jgi:hypothetical protein
MQLVSPGCATGILMTVQCRITVQRVLCTAYIHYCHSSVAFPVFEIFSSTASGVTLPFTVTFCVAKSTSKDSTPKKRNGLVSCRPAALQPSRKRKIVPKTHPPSCPVHASPRQHSPRTTGLDGGRGRSEVCHKMMCKGLSVGTRCLTIIATFKVTCIRHRMIHCSGKENLGHHANFRLPAHLSAHLDKSVMTGDKQQTGNKPKLNTVLSFTVLGQQADAEELLQASKVRSVRGGRGIRLV